MARIDRLPEGAKSVLQIGAVMGREWSEALLREVAGLAEQDLTAHLAALTDAELLYARGVPPQTTYMFKHAFTQDAAYRSLLTARRQELHHRVAVTLEALFPDRLEEHYGPLAHHYLEAAQGDEVAKAIAVRAARWRPKHGATGLCRGSAFLPHGSGGSGASGTRGRSPALPATAGAG